MELSIVMPCLNEAETLETCIKKALGFLKRENIAGEIIVSDNGSTDGSIEIAKRLGARVVNAKTKGYGAALQAGLNKANGKYIIMGDSDDSYDFSNLILFVEELRLGNDLVMGNRFKGGIAKGAMPLLHKYLGNPVLSFIGRLFFNTKIRDFHCGLRGVNNEAYQKMDLKTTGMEFASEMVVKAVLMKMKISEVPTTLSPDGRTRAPHLRSFRDGWRHLRFLLMFSPKWLFLFPGIILLLVSTIGSAFLFINPIKIGTLVFDIHTLTVLSFAFLVGFQFIFFHVFVKKFKVTSGILPESKRFYTINNKLTLENGILVGVIIFILGIGLFSYNFLLWKNTGFSDLQPVVFIRKVLFAVVPIFLGIQVIFYSFILSIISITKK